MVNAMAVQLTQRDRRILDHVKRYRITTNEALLTRFFQPEGLNALKTVRKRLVGPYLQSRPLGIARRHYYQLTPATARMVGEPEEVAAPLGMQALPRAFAVLAFCCLSGKPHERLHRDELREEYPEIAAASFAAHADFCIDEWAGRARLARIIVDYGGEYPALIRKCRSFLLTARQNIAGFADMLHQDAFAIVIITAEETKKQSIISALARHPLEVNVRVSVLPELTILLNPRVET